MRMYPSTRYASPASTQGLKRGPLACSEALVAHLLRAAQITAKDEYSPLCTFLETLLTMIWWAIKPDCIWLLPPGIVFCPGLHQPLRARKGEASCCAHRYPTTVATLSRRARDVIEAAFEASVDGGASALPFLMWQCMLQGPAASIVTANASKMPGCPGQRITKLMLLCMGLQSVPSIMGQGGTGTLPLAGSPLLPSRLHDFGMRGCATVEQTVLGGSAHLLNFDGSDTMSAAYYVQVQACCSPLLLPFKQQSTPHVDQCMTGCSRGCCMQGGYGVCTPTLPQSERQSGCRVCT